MRKFLLVILGLVISVVGAALIAPSFMDWNQYRALISDQATSATGRIVDIDGDISISLLPAPRLVIENARLANVEGASSADMVTLKRLEVRIALAPLLGGRVRVNSVKLIEPVILIEFLENGRNNLAFAPLIKKETPSAPSRAPAIAPPGGGLDVSAFDISVDSFVVENGSIDILDAAKGRRETIRNLNGRFAMADLKGPWEVAGSAVAAGVPLSFEATTGAIVQNRTLPFNLDITVIPGSVHSQFSGAVTGLSSTPTLKGKITAEGKRLDEFVTALTGGIALPKAMARPFEVQANLMASTEGAELSGLGLRFNGSQANGNLSIKSGSETEIKLSLAANRLDLDAGPKSPAMGGKPAPSVNGALPPQITRRPSAASALRSNKGAPSPSVAPFDLKAIPANLSATVNLSAEAITYRGEAVRQAKVNFSLANREVTLNQLSALLPGNSDIAMFGFMDSKDGAPQFEGSVDATTSNLKGLLSWLDIDVAGLSESHLRQFKFGSKITARSEKIAVRDIKALLDGTKITGSGSLSVARRPRIDADIIIDRFNVDSYLPKAPVTAPVAATQSGAANPGTTGAGNSNGGPAAGSNGGPAAGSNGGPAAGAVFQGMAALAAFDAHLKAEIKSLLVRGLPITNTRLDIALDNGNILLNGLEIADAAGIEASVAGGISGLVSSPGSLGPTIKNLKFQMKAPNLKRFYKLSGLKPPFDLNGVGNVEVLSTVSGTLARLNIEGETKAFGGTYTMDGSIQPISAPLRVDVGFRIKHENLARFLRNLGVDYSPSGNLGGMNLGGRLSGSVTKFSVSGLNGQAGGIKLGGTVDIDNSGARPRIVANVTTGDVDVDALVPAKRRAGILGRNSRHANAPLSGFINASWPGTRNPSKTLAKTLVAARGRGGRWSDEKIDLSALGNFDGEAAIKSDSIKFDGYRLSNADLAAVLNNGRLDLRRLTGVLFGGRLNADGSVDASGAAAQIVARYKLEKIDAAAAQKAFGGGQFARGTFDSVGEIGTQGNSVADFISALRGRGTASLSNLDVSSSGVGASAFSGIVQLIRSLNGLAGDLGGKSRKSLANLNGAYTINRGIVSLNDFNLTSDLANGSMKGTADLPAWRIKADGRLKLTQNLVGQLLLGTAAANTVLPFSITGQLDAPNVKLDTASLPRGGIRVPGLDRLRKKKGIGAILDQVLPGLSPAPAPPQPSPQTGTGVPPPQQQPTETQPRNTKPEDFLKNILRGLGR
ncbi:MAG: AsmA family protein [Rhodospirillales bacterium]|nr:AsmA family protein [Rhodospirillales bacterium]